MRFSMQILLGTTPGLLWGGVSADKFITNAIEVYMLFQYSAGAAKKAYNGEKNRVQRLGSTIVGAICVCNRSRSTISNGDEKITGNASVWKWLVLSRWLTRLYEFDYIRSLGKGTPEVWW